MSVTNASRPADWKKKKNFPQSVFHLNQYFMFLSDVHSFVSVLSRLYKVCIVLQISLPENHIQHYLWEKKLFGSCE